MPIQKFRSLEEAERALWASPMHTDLLARIEALWSFSMQLVPRDIPRGVRKFRTLEEANAEREQWVQRRVERLRRERGLA
ncbi:MAG: hypothetical protein FJZ47_25310 [Candidatus Tectomicrobia bacterium]|uniref:Uncharacterized protein n=1 Tax=Tectimicrobiota bacterium TaxID=2528274 RepID=A0A938B763_UNCTE|nr:hypothetical protein [Candidatus Tectomicrobia bacterium]